MNAPTLSIIIPAYNEEDRIGPTLEKITRYMESRNLSFELLIVDDGSTDRTWERVDHFARKENLPGPIHIHRNTTNRGKGYCVRRGMLEARGDYALFTDADLSAPIEELSKLEKAVVDDGGDIAFGSRDVEGSDVQVHQPWWRESSGKLFNQFVRFCTGLPYRDTQCGFKLFRMSRCKDLFERQTIFDFGFDVELLYVAGRWGLEMKEVPVVWRHSTGSKVQFIPHALGMLVDLFKIRVNDWRGHYEILTPAP
ncbi:MAG: dolichyl-phosphate beta-glucosyltransferase [Acidobacteriota bacterium]